jgi:YesN/AraC family two-component response regulator
MERLGLLWIDFTSSSSPPDLFARLHKTLRAEWLSADDDLPARIKAFQPHILCFDFDYPKLLEMLLLRQIKAALPSVPILMLSRHHSADLVLWALRSRVWNYFQKPLDAPDLLAAVHELRTLLKERQGSVRRMVMPAVVSTSEAEPVNPRNAKAVNKAKAYVQANLGEDLTAAKLAEVCCMSYFHFSRTFKRVAGESFNDFVQQARIRKAGELLAHPDATITRVCFDVGFKEVSYFARVFRLVVGVSPTEFRRMLAEPPAHALSATPPDRTYEAPRGPLSLAL